MLGGRGLLRDIHHPPSTFHHLPSTIYLPPSTFHHLHHPRSLRMRCMEMFDAWLVA
ncbi:unnamed protein product [Diplocarpon coronariae]